jgi:ABC-2 type transport system ATP-binding protein
VASVTVLGALSTEERAAVTASGLDLAPVSLQQLVVRLTQKAEHSAAEAHAPRATAMKEEVR